MAYQAVIKINNLMRKMMADNKSLGLVFLAVFSIVGYVVIRRNRGRWHDILFPIGYFLYAKTRIGYRIHQRNLRNRSLTPHTVVHSTILAGVEITPIAVLDDNYAYLVVDSVNKVAVAVDPSDPDAVQKCVRDKGVTLKAILTTHKHWDHSGGNYALKKEIPDLLFYSGRKDSTAGTTNYLNDKDIVKVGSLTFEAIFTPGHTTGHMVYLLHCDPPCLFSGDHIFVGGLGRLFEGNADTMLQSINAIKALDERTLIFPGHEYGLENLKFMALLDPSNTAIQSKLDWVRQQRSRRLSAVPSVLSEEKQYNLFMQTDSAHLKSVLDMPPHSSAASTLAKLRARRDKY